MYYLIGGINAVGKSTVVREILNQRPETKLFQASHMLMAHMGIPGDYAALRRKTQEENRAAYRELLAEFLPVHSEEDWLFDGHYVNLRYGRFSRVIDPWIQQFSVIVLITAPMDDVIARVMTDEASGKRDRGLFPKDADVTRKHELLRRFADEEQVEFLRLAGEYNLPHVTIHHLDDKIEESVAAFLAFDQVVRGG